MNFRVLVICGVHRSGTTYVAEILRRIERFAVLNEPLNERRGIASVPIAYPFVAAEGGRFDRLIDDVLRFARPWGGRSTRRVAGLPRRVLYAVTGGRNRLRWNRLRVAGHFGLFPRRILWKDPFASLASPYLVERHHARVLCMIRHPGAVHLSTERQGWRFDADNLRRQPDLLERFGYDILSNHWKLAESSTAAAIALLWKFVARVASDVAAAHDEVLLVRHEDLCLRPVKVAEQLAGHVGLSVTPRVRRFVESSSVGRRVAGRYGKPYDFVRDSKALVDAWRDGVPLHDQELIREIVGEDLHPFYSEW